MLKRVVLASDLQSDEFTVGAGSQIVEMFENNQAPYRNCCKWMCNEIRSYGDLPSEHIRNIWVGLAKVMCAGGTHRLKIPDDDSLSRFRELVPGCAIKEVEERESDGSTTWSVQSLNRPSWLLGNMSLVSRFVSYMYDDCHWASSGAICDEYLSYVGSTTLKGRCFVDFIKLNGVALGIWCNCKCFFDIVDCVLEQRRKRNGCVHGGGGVDPPGHQS